MTEQQATMLILGGTGKTGRRVAERLVAQGRFSDFVQRAPATGEWNS